MRLALFCFALVGMAYAQDSESNMSCVERLQMPLYPPLAHSAAIQGSLTATAILGSDGVIETKIVGHPLLADAGKRAIAASTFRKSCSGKAVTLVYRFLIDETINPGGPPQISFSYPNQFWISVAPRLPMFQVSPTAR
jgi:hypothetical protein